jgi:hypothetical protein
VLGDDFWAKMLDASSLFGAACTVSRSLLGGEKKKRKGAQPMLVVWI